MKKLDETSIIRIFQKKLGNKKFVSEDVEVFNLDKTKFAVKTDTLVESTDIPSKMNLGDAARKSVICMYKRFCGQRHQTSVWNYICKFTKNYFIIKNS